MPGVAFKEDVSTRCQDLGVIEIANFVASHLTTTPNLNRLRVALDSICPVQQWNYCFDTEPDLQSTTNELEGHFSFLLVWGASSVYRPSLKNRIPCAHNSSTTLNFSSRVWEFIDCCLPRVSHSIHANLALSKLIRRRLMKSTSNCILIEN